MAEAAAVAAINFVKAAAAKFSVELTVAQAAAIINATTYAIASVGVNAYMSSQREFPNQARPLQLGIAPDLPRRIQVGRRANAGVLVDWFVSGPKNQFLWLVKYLHEGPGDAINEIWADGRRVWNGTLNHAQSVRLTEFDSPDERLRVFFYDGRVGQTASSELTGEGHVSANNRATGCCYVIEKLLWDPDTTPAPPATVYVSGGSHFYDRRVGAMDLDDPSTWASTNNPAVAADHYLLGYNWPGMSRPRLGVGLPAADVPYDRFNSNANIAEELVALTIGSQQRYEANGFIQADQVHADILVELFKAMDARPADFGGSVSAISHASSSSILTITDDDLIEGSSEVYEPKRSWGQLVGGAEGSYQDPANNYQPAAYPNIENATWLAEDGGKTPVLPFNLPFETDATRAQRLARLFVNRERRQATLSGQYAPRVLELEEGDWFTRQGARFSGGKVFEVVEPPQLDPNTMIVTMSALEVDPTDSAWSTVDAQDVDTPVGDTNDSPPALPVPNVTISTFQWSFGQYNYASIQFNHTEFDDIPLDVDIEIAESDGAGGPNVNNRIIDVKIAAGRQYGNYAGLLPGQTYVVRGRSRGGTRQSDWSAWVTVVAGVAAYGQIGDGTATLGSNVYREDGLTLLGDNDVVTPLGISLGFQGEGVLARENNLSWGGGLLIGRPAELTDGRVGTGLNSSGEILVPIPGTIKLSSDIMSHVGGGTYTGELNADLTAIHQAASIAGQGEWATSGLSVDEILHFGRRTDGLTENPFFSDPSYSASGGLPPGWNDWSLASYLTRATRATGTGYCIAGAANVAGFGNLGIVQSPTVITPNGLYRMRLQARRTGGSYAGAGVLVQWLQSDGTYISADVIACASDAPVGAGVSSFHDGLTTWDRITKAPANAARANIYAMWSWTGMPGYTATDASRLAGEFYECNLYPATEAERRTNTQTDNADQTSGNQAASVIGQGALALLNSVTEGLISVPDLAAINANLGAITGGSININSRFVVAADGTVTILSATSGARLSINDQVLEVYDASNQLRVRLGIW